MKKRNKTAEDGNLLWYKDAIIYELHIKAFMDANGDGIGDFAGLLTKLDYLEELGVTAIWLLPFYISPQRDDGYDIQDYYTINPAYGQLRDFKKFVKAAHERNLKVITELVINHTSDQHPWFKRARKAPKGSPEREYYVWSDDPNKYKGVRIIFQDTELSNWTYDNVAKQYFWHRFFHHQPDLNFDNPLVQEEVFKIIDYWAATGVDGFRLDAVPYLYEREGTNCENLPETHDFLKKLRKHLDDNYPGRMFLAEANMWPEDSASYFGDGDECHMNYHFPIMPRMFMAMRMENRYPITDIFDQTPDIPDNCQWAIFLRNHDELTLEMVTDEERDYMYKVYAENPKVRINLGLRRRLAPLMNNNRKKIELINTLLYSLPGTPVIYYGDEIGMGDNFYLGDRDGVRTPMQWSPDRNGGFSKANPQQLYLPMILDPEHHYEAVNVETQQSNGSSLLWWTRRIIKMRKKYKAFGRGDMEFIHSENPKVLCFTRTYEDQAILVVVNLSRFTEAVALELEGYAGAVPIEVFSRNEFPVISETEAYPFTLSPYAYHWFELQNKTAEKEEDGLRLEASSLKGLLKGENLQHFEHDILPGFVRHSEWFKTKDRKIESVHVYEKIPLDYEGMESFLLVLEVSYESGLPDFFQVGFAFGRKGENRIVEHYPQSVFFEAKVGDSEGFAYDALFDQHLHDALFFSIGRKKRIEVKDSVLGFFDEKKKISKYLKKHNEPKARLLISRRANTSLLYNNDFYLKVYRKLDRAINPDLEIVRYVGDQKGFPNISPVVATIQLEWSADDSMVLGMMQEAIEYQTDTWSYLLDFLKRYIERIQLRETSETKAPLKGTLSVPIAQEELEDEDMELIGVLSSTHMKLLGQRTGALHRILMGDEDHSVFSPEEFSLHYQRGLFSSFQALVRESFQLLKKQIKHLPELLQEDAQYVLERKDQTLKVLKKVYAKKLDIVKIRCHGDFHLRQVLFTGQDFVFIDFEGESGKTYSERRLKRSAIRDLAGMIRSFHNVAYEAIFNNEEAGEKGFSTFRPWLEKWYHYISQFYMRAYMEEVEDLPLLPKDPEDLSNMLDVFLLELALVELRHGLKHFSLHTLIPLVGIRQILERHEDQD
ncbi:MAG: maltose alpha-D-glucosyltransferase [Bacteroidota bacterium]